MLVNKKLDTNQVEMLKSIISKEDYFLMYSYLVARGKNATYFGQFENNRLIATLAFLKGLPFNAFALYRDKDKLIDLPQLISYVKQELNIENMLGTTMVSDDDLKLFTECNLLTSPPKKDFLMKHMDDSKLFIDRRTIQLDKSFQPMVKNFMTDLKMIAFNDEEFNKFPFVGIIEDSKLVSMAGFHLYHERLVEVGNIGTKVEARGKGYGKIVSSMITKIGKEKSDEVYLYVFADNNPAIHIYKDIGYETISTLNFIEFKL